jgi:putative heme-binding domain-containing protein
MLALDNTEENRKVLTDLLAPREPVTFQKAVLDLLAQSQDDALSVQLLGKWARLTPAVRAKAIDILLQRNAWNQDLLAALEEGKVSPSDFSIVQSQRLIGQFEEEQADRVANALGRTGARLNNEEREAMLAKFLGLAEREGDIDRGRMVFAQNCARCHLYEGQGVEVGPDLSGIAQNDRQAILLEILDPNRSLEGTYRQWNITTYDGTLLSGRLLAESRDAITLLMPEGEKQVIPRAEIEDLSMSSLSLMPEGFESLPEEDLVSLIDFLKQGG